MTIHVSATTGCNLGCTYCYENPDRERSEEWAQSQYDMEKIMEGLREFKKRYPDEAPGLHGGEPLLMARDDIRRIFEWVNNNYEESPHIQTNATLIDEEVIQIFKEHNVSVGVSCDGPKELNRLRLASGERNKEKMRKVTDKMSERTLNNIDRMLEEGISVGVIVVLHEANAGTEEKFEKLLDWLDHLNKNGASGHFNPAIPYEDIQTDVSLDPETLKKRYLRTWEWMKKEKYRTWNPMNNYVDNLLGLGLKNCVNNTCDVYNAAAAKIIDGDGETTGCGKTWSTVGDGVPFLQGPSSGNEYEETEERYQMLKQLPGGPDKKEGEPDLGGCKGCKFWNLCQGGCPSSGIQDDYRSRTIWCEAKYALYEKIEEDIQALMPNVTLITDYPWDAELAELASRRTLDIKPFGAIRPDTEGRSSTYSGARNPFGQPEDRVPNDAMPEDFHRWENRVERAKEQYGEENLTINEKEKRIHADSAVSKNKKKIETGDEGEDKNKEKSEQENKEKKSRKKKCGCKECKCGKKNKGTDSNKWEKVDDN